MRFFSDFSPEVAPPDAEAIAGAAAFLRGIGISCEKVSSANGFLTGVEISDGGLLYEPQCPVSNLLHEAGHIATVPQPWRQRIAGNVSGAHRAMFADLERMELDPDSPLMRAAMQCSDPEATAWAWAAGKHLGLPEELIILDTEYDGDGAGIRLALSIGQYLGIHGLAHAGFCSIRTGRSPLPPFPRMAHWTQPAQPSSEWEAELPVDHESPCA